MLNARNVIYSNVALTKMSNWADCNILYVLTYSRHFYTSGLNREGSWDIPWNEEFNGRYISLEAWWILKSHKKNVVPLSKLFIVWCNRFANLSVTQKSFLNILSSWMGSILNLKEKLRLITKRMRRVVIPEKLQISLTYYLSKTQPFSTHKYTSLSECIIDCGNSYTANRLI